MLSAAMLCCWVGTYAYAITALHVRTSDPLISARHGGPVVVCAALLSFPCWATTKAKAGVRVGRCLGSYSALVSTCIRCKACLADCTCADEALPLTC